MNRHTQVGIIIFSLALALPVAALCEETNAPLSLFGITVAKPPSEAETQFELGSAYYNGDGTDRNVQQAMECFQEAAALGHAQAQFNLGICYMDADNDKHSDKAAAQWFIKAAEQGVEEALYPLGICYYNLEQYTEAYAWALWAESKGDTRLRELFDTMFSDEETAAGKARFEELKEQSGEKKDETAE